VPYEPYSIRPKSRSQGSLTIKLVWLCVVAFPFAVALIVLAAVGALS
jgi:hypothetical protein